MTTEWFKVVEQNVLMFVNNDCVRGSLCRVRTADLYRAWLERGGKETVSGQMFTRVLRKMPLITLEKSRGGYMVIGLELKPHHGVAVAGATPLIGKQPEPMDIETPWEERDGI